MKPRILVCNDDGINGPGLRPLADAMRALGRVTVVVPAQERSADSHALTLHKPIRVHRVSPGVYTINGKPADCARLGILELLKGRVDLVVSGINLGFNLGDDTVYSGTVAAAREAALLDAPAIAFSQDPEETRYGPAARFARSLARQVLARGLPRGICLNVNFPRPLGVRFKGAAAARLGRRVYSKEVTRRSDPRGREYFWLAGSDVTSVRDAGTDVVAVAKGLVSVTPLHVDTTDATVLADLRKWDLSGVRR